MVTGCRVETLGQLPASRAVLFDLTPRQIVRLAGHDLDRSFAARLARFGYGPGVFKLDWALRAPIPWRDPRAASAITVHLGGTIDEMARSEYAVSRGRIAERPYVLLAQPSLFDPTRAPAGAHTAWAYCHVPNGSTADMTARIEDQVERFAPGFRDVILARSALGPAQLEARNANLVGGDINGGALSLVPGFSAPDGAHLRDRQPAAVHLLRLDSARRWRARPVRSPRRERRAGLGAAVGSSVILSSSHACAWRDQSGAVKPSVSQPRHPELVEGSASDDFFQSYMARYAAKHLEADPSTSLRMTEPEISL